MARFEGIDDNGEFMFWTPGAAGMFWPPEAAIMGDETNPYPHDHQPRGLVLFGLPELVRRISDKVTSGLKLKMIPPEVEALFDDDPSEFDLKMRQFGIVDAVHEYENAVSLRDFAREPYHTKQAKDVKRRFRLRAYVRAVGLLCMIARDSAHRVFCPGGVGAQYAANDFKAVMHPRKVLC